MYWGKFSPRYFGLEAEARTKALISRCKGLGEKRSAEV
jgi:hypothetical protein